jgi:hypothetical protein
MRALASQRGYDFAEVVRSSCTPLLGATHLLPRVPSFAGRCERFNRATLSLFLSDPRIRIVVLTASWSAPLFRNWKDGWLAPVPGIDATPDSGSVRATIVTHNPVFVSMLSYLKPPPAHVPTAEANLILYRTALAATVLTLQSAGKRVILVQDTPSFAADPLLLVRTSHIPVRRALAHFLNPASDTASHTFIDAGFAPPESSPAIAASEDLINQASQQLNAQLFNPKPAFCPTPAICAYRDGDTLLFIDSTHLSAAGATRALTALPLPASRSAP